MNIKITSLANRVMLAMSLIVFLVVISSVLSVVSFTSTKETFVKLIENETVMNQLASDSKNLLLQCRRDEKDALYNDDASLKRAVMLAADGLFDNSKKMNDIAEKTSDTKIIENVVNLSQNVESYRSAFQKAIAVSVGQERLRASLPMRKFANEVDKLLVSLSSEIDKRVTDTKAEALQYATKMRGIIILSGGLIVFFCLFIAVFIMRSVMTPIKRINGLMKDLANGDMGITVPYCNRSDEIGNMANAVVVFKNNMIKARELDMAEKQALAVKEQRQIKINAATERFQTVMQEIVKSVASSATELQASAQSLSATAEETSRQSSAVAAASEQATSNVQTVASASEEMTASIGEISEKVTRSSQIASKAVENALSAGRSVNNMVEATKKIGEVSNMISEISAQTNLLALNATIEAARAGDAGKGFAVVASEVKNLANSSAKATEEIAGQIVSVQQISRQSAQAINDISDIIKEMDEISSAIAEAIQQQAASTQEIARNAVEASKGTQDVSRNIISVNEAASSTGSSSTEMLGAAQELAQQATRLKVEFDSFVESIKNA